MKKILVLAMVAIMALTLMACGNNEENSANAANPMTAVDSLEELSEMGNCAMIKPEGVEITDEAFYMIEGEPQIFEYSFKVDGIECFLRFADADIDQDISGIYVKDGTLFEGAEGERIYIENDDLKAQRWVTVDGQYVFVAKDNSELDWEKYDSICSQFSSMEPANWSSDVPYATYQAMEGSYVDYDADAFGSVSITGDHLGIYVVINKDESNRLYWEIEAELKDNQLVYDKEVINQINVNEDTGESSMKQLEDGGAGSIEVKDGKLVFENAYSKELKTLVLVPSEE